MVALGRVLHVLAVELPRDGLFPAVTPGRFQ